VSALTILKPKAGAGNGNGRPSNWLSPLNLHWAGVGALALVNVYFLVRMLLLWHAASYYSADAVAQQKVELKAAVIAAEPLRGLDAKLSESTAAADRFSRERLPATDSAMLRELGNVAKTHGVRLIRVQYVFAPVMAGSAGELTETRLDATLSGDYRPLVQFINSLERDKMFFVINGLTLTGQQSGTVNLRVRLTTYLRGGVDQTLPASNQANGETALLAAPSVGGAQ
jgi:type IV pilus assembly protein PilO